MELPTILSEAILEFAKLPGIGEKTATRQTLHLSNWDKIDLLKFGESIKALAQLKYCQDCGLFSEEDLCRICSEDERKNAGTICVVESITDALAIERTGHYKGLLHILGGVLNPLMGIGPEQLSIKKLSERIKNYQIKEVILAVNPSLEGDATCSYLKMHIGDDIAVDRIGFGIPIGGSLEYLDPMTIGMALNNKKKM